MRKPKAERVRIVSASDLPPCMDCGEPFCLIHGRHYGDCDCMGPSQAEDEGYTLVNGEDGKLYGIAPAKCRPLP